MPAWEADDASEVEITLWVQGTAKSTITLTAKSDAGTVAVSDKGVLNGIAHFSVEKGQDLSFFIQAFAFHGGGDVMMLCGQNHHGLPCRGDNGKIIKPSRQPVKVGQIPDPPTAPVVIDNVGMVGPQ